jgi:hypothetical protein
LRKAAGAPFLQGTPPAGTLRQVEERYSSLVDRGLIRIKPRVADVDGLRYEIAANVSPVDLLLAERDEDSR